MGLLDVPKGLISRLPLIGGSDDSKPADEPPEDASVAEVHGEDEPEFDDGEGQPNEADEEPDEAEDEPDEAEDEPEEPDDAPDDEDDPDVPHDDTPDEPDADSDGKQDISGTTAPSIGPNTVIEKDSAEERLARHEQSDTDAMGLDKRRSVIGGNYSASFGKQLIRWAVVVLVVVAAGFGAKLLVDDLDQPPAKAADQAPWSGSDQAPAPLE